MGEKVRFSFGGDPGVDVLKCRRAVITKEYQQPS
jgi:hypothetical protein